MPNKAKQSSQNIQKQGPQPIATREVFEGLLPPPRMLEAYEALLPGAAERIMQLAEREEKHRHDIENEALKSDIEARRAQSERGMYRDKSAFRSDLYAQTLGGMIAAACAGAGIWCALHDKNLGAAICLGLPVAAIIEALRISHHKKAPHKTDAKN